MFSGQSYSGLKVDYPYENKPLQGQDPRVFYQTFATNSYLFGNMNVGAQQHVCSLNFVSTLLRAYADSEPLLGIKQQAAPHWASLSQTWGQQMLYHNAGVHMQPLPSASRPPGYMRVIEAGPPPINNTVISHHGYHDTRNGSFRRGGLADVNIADNAQQRQSINPPRGYTHGQGLLYPVPRSRIRLLSRCIITVSNICPETDKTAEHAFGHSFED
ncbi:hypothetical protein JB92DRAFT_3112547 [Gautieria morchelliformis]|nr:hypothetical protein JB92DRAFT_3112547 [Gautieria morchelliformis]